MSFRGEQFDKSNGITYIYEATSVWNAAKQRFEQKRIYIGKKDPVIGNLIPDKGFYSIKGINPLLKNHTKFAIGVPFTTDVSKELVNKHKDGMCCSANAIMVGENIYYAQTHRTMLKNRRVNYHVYYDEQRHADAEKELAGYFIILTNHYKDPQHVLEIYRNKDAVEKSFNNLKSDLDLERLRIHTDEAMEGRIFIGFISLIIMSQMRKNNVYDKYSFNELIAELKKLKVIKFKGGKFLMTELTKKHKYIFKAMGIQLSKLA